MPSGQSGHIAGCPGRPLTGGSSAPPPDRRSSGGIRAPSEVLGGERGGKGGGAQTRGGAQLAGLNPGPHGAGSYCPQPLPSQPLKPDSSSRWPTTLSRGPPSCMASVQTRAWSRGRAYLQLYSLGRGTEGRTAMGEGDREVRTLQRWTWGDKTMSLGLHLGGSEEPAQREPSLPCDRDTWLPCQGSSGDLLCLSPLLGARPFPASSRWSPRPPYPWPAEVAEHPGSGPVLRASVKPRGHRAPDAAPRPPSCAVPGGGLGAPMSLGYGVEFSDFPLSHEPCPLEPSYLGHTRSENRSRWVHPGGAAGSYPVRCSRPDGRPKSPGGCEEHPGAAGKLGGWSALASLRTWLG